MSLQDADLTFKSHLDGGERLVGQGQATKAWTDPRSQDFVVLVHGFRTDERDASINYRQFQRNLAQSDKTLGNRVRTLSWPSLGRFRDLDAYFSAVDEVAQDVGHRLADYIKDDITNPFYQHRDYVFVAHSLGCRVVLEMARRLHAANPKYVKSVRLVLMAPAVRIEDFELTSQMRYRDCVEALQDSIVLFSPEDGILKNLFPRGMKPKSTEAVGLWGVPRDAWAQGPRQMHTYKHHHYWEDKNQSASQAVAEFVGVPRSGPLPFGLVNSGGALAGPTLGSL